MCRAVWTDKNIAHIALHGLTADEVEYVLAGVEEEGVSRSSGRPIAFGHLPDGRRVAVVYERIDELRVYPVTAYEV
jgi:uncharacterized DUF497 family protein